MILQIIQISTLLCSFSQLLEATSTPGYYENGKPMVNENYAIMVKLWTNVIRTEISFFKLEIIGESKQPLAFIDDWIDEWQNEIIKSPVGPYGTGFKEDFWDTITPKIDSLLMNFLSSDKIIPEVANSLKAHLRLARHEFDEKLRLFSEAASDSNPEYFVSGPNNRPTDIYEKIIARWCDLVNVSLQLAVGDTANMTNGTRFLELTFKWLQNWSNSVVEDMPGHNGEDWRLHFLENFKPRVNTFFHEQTTISEDGNDIKWRESEVQSTFQLIESGVMEAAGKFANAAAGLLQKPKVTIEDDDESEKVKAHSPESQVITRTEEL